MDTFSEDDNELEGLLEAASSYEKRGFLSEAELYFTRALYVKPNSVDALCGLGLVHSRLNDWRLGTEYYEKALALSPRDLGLCLKVAVGYSEIHNLEKALEYFSRVLDIDPSNRMAKSNIADIRKTLNTTVETVVKRYGRFPN